MDRSRLHWIYPMDWLKALYGILGAPYPVLSYFGAGLLGAALMVLLWHIGATQYKKDHPVAPLFPVNDIARRSSQLAKQGLFSEEISIYGPDGIKLTIHRINNLYAWRLFKSGLNNAGKCTLRVINAQSWSAVDGGFRQPTGFSAHLDSMESVTAGSNTPSNVFLRPLETIEFGSTQDAGKLEWPNGDSSPIELWLLHLQMDGLSVSWTPKILARRERGSDLMKFAEYQSPI